jgi:hemoglobin-like flavoprotein
MMNTKQINLVKTSFEKLVPFSEQFAAHFYNRLFEIDPNLRPLFRGEITEQGKKLMSMLKVVVANLENLNDLIPAVQALGMRHAHYGVQAEHYTTVMNALVWTLEKYLGSAFDLETKQAWATAYNTLSAVMQEAIALSKA